MKVASFFALSILLLAACNEEPAPEVDPSNFVTRQEVCLEDGGRWVPRENTGGMVCLRTPADAGQRCEKSTDCETECLARSKTCAPVTPLFGCNEVLNALGASTTLCLE